MYTHAHIKSRKRHLLGPIAIAGMIPTSSKLTDKVGQKAGKRGGKHTQKKKYKKGKTCNIRD